MKDVEIEIQVNVGKSKSLLAFLEKNAHFKYENHQVDEYFSPPHRNFIGVRPVREWLRSRNSDGQYSINYKNWYFDKNDKSYHCDEYETQLADLASMKKILKVLNFRTLVRVDKVRQVWTYKNYEIAVDSIKKLGDFVEIEYRGRAKNVNPRQMTQKMIEFLKKIGVGEIKRNYVGYPFQLLFSDEVKYEKQ